MTAKKSSGLTYRSAGVDIDAGNHTVSLIKNSVKSTYRPEVLGDLGGFGGLFALDIHKYKQPVLVSGTDGVGTKLKLAFLLDKHDTIGQDAVAMCVNDILVQGAEPLFFLDYLAVGKLEPQKAASIIKGVANACRESGCALIGGETAEMSGFYNNDEYDIAGFAVGAVEKENLITGSKVHDGDLIIGLPSSGIHSNGYSLVRKICFDRMQFKGDEYIKEFGSTLAEELLKPTRLYPKVCLPLIKKFDLHALAHITGGGFYDNIARVLPKKCDAVIDASAWQMQPVFSLLQKWGSVDWHEMYRTFNMGIGMIIIVSDQDAQKVQDDLSQHHEKSYIIGKIVSGEKKVQIKRGVFDA